jgi:hypothetical protein
MKYRVIITSEALASVEQFLDYLTVDQKSPLTAERYGIKKECK